MAAEAKVEEKSKKSTKSKKAAPKKESNRMDQSQKITLLVKDNPKREGTNAFDKFALYKKGMTVAEYVALGGSPGDVRYDVEREYISIK